MVKEISVLFAMCRIPTMLFAVTGKKLFFFFSKSNHNTYKNITRIPFSPPGYVDYAEEGTRAIFCTSMT